MTARLAALSRRQLLHTLAGLGVGSAVFQRALAAQVEQTGAVTPEMVKQAEWIAGLQLAEEDRKTVAGSLQGLLRDFGTLRKLKLDNSVPPAVQFHPAGWSPATEAISRGSVTLTESAAPKKPDSA